MPERDPLQVDPDRLAAFCRRWSVRELAVFGSVLRDDFGPDSDVDICVVFDPAAQHDVDELIEIEEELSALFGGRPIDLVQRRNIRNPFMRYEILTSRRVLYAA